MATWEGYGLRTPAVCSAAAANMVQALAATWATPKLPLLVSYSRGGDAGVERPRGCDCDRLSTTLVTTTASMFARRRWRGPERILEVTATHGRTDG